MSKYDEKAKERISRYLQKNCEQVRLTVPKGTLAKYKAFAATKGISMTEMITRYIDSEIEKSGFIYEESADE